MLCGPTSSQQGWISAWGRCPDACAERPGLSAARPCYIGGTQEGCVHGPLSDCCTHEHLSPLTLLAWSTCCYCLLSKSVHIVELQGRGDRESEVGRDGLGVREERMGATCKHTLVNLCVILPQAIFHRWLKQLHRLSPLPPPLCRSHTWRWKH